jgi:hypothetical protein
MGSWRMGVAGGGTYRVKLGQNKHPLDLMLGFGHVFVGTQQGNNPAGPGLNGLSGAPCNDSGTGQITPIGAPCVSGVQRFRTNWPVNLGTITNSVNVINVGASYRF